MGVWLGCVHGTRTEESPQSLIARMFSRSAIKYYHQSTQFNQIMLENSSSNSFRSLEPTMTPGIASLSWAAVSLFGAPGTVSARSKTIRVCCPATVEHIMADGSPGPRPYPRGRDPSRGRPRPSEKVRFLLAPVIACHLRWGWVFRWAAMPKR